MIDPKELTLRVLAEINEAGEENVAALMNTVFDRLGDTSEIESMQSALGILTSAGLIRIAMVRDAQVGLLSLSVDESLAEIAKMQNCLRFRLTDRHWAFAGQIHPEVVATDLGIEKSEQILDERGHKWWRQA